MCHRRSRKEKGWIDDESSLFHNTLDPRTESALVENNIKVVVFGMETLVVSTGGYDLDFIAGRDIERERDHAKSFIEITTYLSRIAFDFCLSTVDKE